MSLLLCSALPELEDKRVTGRYKAKTKRRQVLVAPAHLAPRLSPPAPSKLAEGGAH